MYVALTSRCSSTESGKKKKYAAELKAESTSHFTEFRELHEVGTSGLWPTIFSGNRLYDAHQSLLRSAAVTPQIQSTQPKPYLTTSRRLDVDRPNDLDVTTRLRHELRAHMSDSPGTPEDHPSLRGRFWRRSRECTLREHLDSTD
ncbi:hypothetical protein KGM_209437 [Danaus plexippus plexippus]|uniref:Uncharacterized protein n=1 Tax=Danaus plexippus plexippus TaxID=278856 RepID=A0A212F696_DANPL|nr:hypothetical protein KGM_209437 [Danaus plexippus plexippus]